MKKILLFLFVMASFTSSLSSAEKLKGGYGACTSSELLDEWTTASVKEDITAWLWLLENGCVRTAPDIQVSVLDRSWTTVKVRAYVGEVSIIIWTYPENIASND